MTQYRAELQFVTSGNATVTVTTDWLPHRDMVAEVVDSLRPFEDGRQKFVEFEIQQKTSIEGESA